MDYHPVFTLLVSTEQATRIAETYTTLVMSRGLRDADHAIISRMVRDLHHRGVLIHRLPPNLHAYVVGLAHGIIA
jgi:hypothetical protein